MAGPTNRMISTLVFPLAVVLEIDLVTLGCGYVRVYYVNIKYERMYI